jgi:hypothetical protein
MMRLALGVAFGAVAGWLARGRRLPEDHPVAVAAPPHAPPCALSPLRVEPPPPTHPGIESERDKLVDVCVWAYESSPSRAVQRRMRHTLQDVGVSLLEPTDVPYDPAQHERVGAEEGKEGMAAGTVARTLRPGVLDGERLVRPAQVVVYTAAHGGPTTEVLSDADRP